MVHERYAGLPNRKDRVLGRELVMATDLVTGDMIAQIRGDMTDEDAPNSDWPETWDSGKGYEYLAKRLSRFFETGMLFTGICKNWERKDSQ